MGPIQEWKRLMAQSSKTGYNMIHFVPLQKRGASNSPYSLFDQLTLSDDLFPSQATSSAERLKLLKAELERMQREDQLLSMSDIVWNHTASNSPWLSEHPESGFRFLCTHALLSILQATICKTLRI